MTVSATDSARGSVQTLLQSFDWGRGGGGLGPSQQCKQAATATAAWATASAPFLSGPADGAGDLAQ